ncbi:MAG: molybdopterin molybdotransferase MoeA [Nitrospinae bacterium]|nr:molybdopterin molybdotransferase MoeA [Nitrospinota bacterium]
MPKGVERKHDDVRMRGFATRHDFAEALALLRARITPLPNEVIPLDDALGRVLAEDIIARVDVPHFDRSAVDGYGLRARDTFGASDYNLIPLTLKGEVLPGCILDLSLSENEAVRIMTGAPLPLGADAVVMAEYAEEEGGTVNILQPIAPYKNVGRIGEDIRKGDVVLTRGRRLRPQDLGVLASIQAARVSVYRRPRVALLITGNELVEVGQPLTGCHIMDSNSFTLSGLARRLGALPVRKGIIRDDYALIKKAIQEAAEDVVIVTGGTSVGAEDFAPLIIQDLGELVVHGVAMRPSSPAGFGFIQQRPIFLIPGNPVSALVTFDAFVGPTLQLMQGLEPAYPYAKVRGKLARKIASAIGRVDFVRVRLTDTGVDPLRVTGASILSSTTRADGFVIVDKNSEGLDEGEEVEVYVY